MPSRQRGGPGWQAWLGWQKAAVRRLPDTQRELRLKLRCTPAAVGASRLLRLCVPAAGGAAAPARGLAALMPRWTLGCGAWPKRLCAEPADARAAPADAAGLAAGLVAGLAALVAADVGAALVEAPALPFLARGGASDAGRTKGLRGSLRGDGQTARTVGDWWSCGCTWLQHKADSRRPCVSRHSAVGPSSHVLVLAASACFGTGMASSTEPGTGNARMKTRGKPAGRPAACGRPAEAQRCTHID